ncbi:MAG TPA: LuxR C-terminal-related transcriptional regulator [Candidatus Paceibacterota bacterium]|nr:LuxR C-terminal-related transcriptional regulator [Candidatus Paceibacterota bacterium]
MENELFNQPLTERDKKIMNLICHEKTVREIGEMVNLSPRTVEGEIPKIAEKIGVQGKVGIAVYAVKNGIYIE